MADIFDLGVDFGLSYFKSKTEKKKVTRKEYNKSPIDFYNQSLEESTGIGVLGDPVKKEEEEKKAININMIGKPEEGSSENPNALDMNQMLSESSFVSKAISSELKNTPTDIMSWQYTAKNKTYGEALASRGYKDRSPSFKLFDTDIYSATLPKSGKDVKEGIKGAFSWESLAKSGLSFLGLDSKILGVAGGFVTGRSIPNALGNNSYRPDHAILGGVFDIVNSIQFADVAVNSAAINAYTGSGMSNQFSPTTGYDHVAGRATGFNAEVGGHLVTKRAGSTSYTGGFASYETNKAVEALTKGYLPSGYNNKNETGERGVTLKDSSGGMYSEKGAYHYVGGTAAAGTMQAARDLAETYFGKGRATGTNVGIITKSLQQARDQYGILGGKKVKDPRSLSVIIRDNIKTLKKDVVPTLPEREPTYVKGPDLGDAAGAVGSGASLDNISGPTNKTVTSQNNYGDQGNQDDTSGDNSYGDSAGSFGGMGDYNEGGFVGKNKNSFAEGGPAGFIEGPPEQFNDQTTIADDIPLTVKDGTFVLNAPAVENEGSSSVQKMLAEGYQKAMTRDVGNGHSIQTGKIPNTKELDIQISRGEVVVPPHVARAIGYDRLEKINNRGKREVERRQKAGNQEKVQAGQGFAAGGGEQTENEVFTIDKVADSYKEKYATPKLARLATMKLARKMPLADALAILMWGEAKNLGDEGLEGAAHVLINRANAEKYPGFGGEIYEEITRTYGKKDKIFQFNAYEPTKFRETIKKFKKDKDTYLRVRNIAEEVMAGARKDFTNNALFFWNPNTSRSNWYKDQVNSKQFKETTRTINPNNKKTLHVYHIPYDFKAGTNVIPQETPIEKFKPLDDLPQPIRRPTLEPNLKPRPEPDRSGGGGFMFRGVGRNYETEGIISIN